MKKAIFKTSVKILEMGIGALMLGGIIKGYWLENNIFVWLTFIALATAITVITKSLDDVND